MLWTTSPGRLLSTKLMNGMTKTRTIVMRRQRIRSVKRYVFSVHSVPCPNKLICSPYKESDSEDDDLPPKRRGGPKVRGRGGVAGAKSVNPEECKQQ